MALTYRVLSIQDSIVGFDLNGNALKELQLTDLNSEERFQNRVLVLGAQAGLITGVVFDGPDNWRGRFVAVHHSTGKKPLEKWVKDDLIIDENPKNK